MSTISGKPVRAGFTCSCGQVTGLVLSTFAGKSQPSCLPVVVVGWSGHICPLLQVKLRAVDLPSVVDKCDCSECPLLQVKRAAGVCLWKWTELGGFDVHNRRETQNQKKYLRKWTSSGEKNVHFCRQKEVGRGRAGVLPLLA